jgi:hypothetical protein
MRLQARRRCSNPGRICMMSFYPQIAPVRPKLMLDALAAI